MELAPPEIAQYQTDHDLLIELRTEMRGLRQDFKDAKAQYVTQAEFWPIKMLVYGCAGLMLMAVIVALVALVVAK